MLLVIGYSCSCRQPEFDLCVFAASFHSIGVRVKNPRWHKVFAVLPLNMNTALLAIARINVR